MGVKEASQRLMLKSTTNPGLQPPGLSCLICTMGKLVVTWPHTLVTGAWQILQSPWRHPDRARCPRKKGEREVSLEPGQLDIGRIPWGIRSRPSGPT